MFWTDTRNGKVWQATLSDGSNSTIIMSDLEHPCEFVNCMTLYMYTNIF